MSLRTELIRLAKSNPEVKKEVLEMLKTSAKEKIKVPTGDMRKAYYKASDGIYAVLDVADTQAPFSNDIAVKAAASLLKQTLKNLDNALKPYAWD